MQGVSKAQDDETGRRINALRARLNAGKEKAAARAEAFRRLRETARRAVPEAVD